MVLKGVCTDVLRKRCEGDRGWIMDALLQIDENVLRDLRRLSCPDLSQKKASAHSPHKNTAVV